MNLFFSDYFFNSSFNSKSTENIGKIYEATNNLVNKIKLGEIDLANIIYSQNTIEESKKIYQELSSFKTIIILAVGGSSLGGKSFAALKPSNNLIFVESIDPQTIYNKLHNINLEEAAFLSISKSGETTETICQTLIAVENLKKCGLSAKKHFFILTQNYNSTLGKIAQNLECKIFTHPQIGGRYSCFSSVGLVPALICNLNIEKIISASQKIINHFIKNQEYFINNCLTQILLYQKGFNNNVLIPYIDSLKNFNNWYRQLCSESLGKEKFGITPINSMGTVDQHSQLQLYLEGVHNKYFTFIINNKFNNDFIINDAPNCSTIFHKKKLSQILRIEHDSTIAILKSKNLPVRLIEINQVNEESLAALMTNFMLEIIIIAFAENINPFNQDAVETRKAIAKSMLQAI